jgi:hypothetical protein
MRSVPFRPRGFAPPRRFAPETGSRAYCSSLPTGVHCVSSRILPLASQPDDQASPQRNTPEHVLATSSRAHARIGIVAPRKRGASMSGTKVQRSALTEARKPLNSSAEGCHRPPRWLLAPDSRANTGPRLATLKSRGISTSPTSQDGSNESVQRAPKRPKTSRECKSSHRYHSERMPAGGTDAIGLMDLERSTAPVPSSEDFCSHPGRGARKALLH